MGQPTADQIAGYLSIFIILVCLATGMGAALWTWLEDQYERFAAVRGPVMSRAEDAAPEKKPVATPVAAIPAPVVDRIAKPGNEDKTPLPVAVETTPADAREVIRRQAQIEAVAALVNAELVPMTKAITTVFGVSPSGRADSPYQQIRKALDAHLKPAGPKFRNPDGTVRTRDEQPPQRDPEPARAAA